MDGLVVEWTGYESALLQGLANHAGISLAEAAGDWQREQRAVGGDGHGWPGDADCMHQRCESAAGAGGVTATGAYAARSTGRGAGTHSAEVAAGERDAGLAGRRAGNWCCFWRAAPACGDGPGQPAAIAGSLA